MRQSVDIDLAFIRLGLTERAGEAEIRSRADQLRGSATRQQADRYLFEAIDELERDGLARLAPGRRRRRRTTEGAALRLAAVMVGCFGVFLMVGLVVGAGVAAVGVSDTVTRWLVGLVPLLAVPVSLVIVAVPRSGSAPPSGTMEA